MATWISDEGYILEIHLIRMGELIRKDDVQNWVGAGYGIFYLDTEFLMLVDLSAKARGAKRNIRAMELLRMTALEPLTEIFGDVLIAHRHEVAFDNLRLPH